MFAGDTKASFKLIIILKKYSRYITPYDYTDCFINIIIIKYILKL